MTSTLPRPETRFRGGHLSHHRSGAHTARGASAGGRFVQNQNHSGHSHRLVNNQRVWSGRGPPPALRNSAGASRTPSTAGYDNGTRPVLAIAPPPAGGAWAPEEGAEGKGVERGGGEGEVAEVAGGEARAGAEAEAEAGAGAGDGLDGGGSAG